MIAFDAVAGADVDDDVDDDLNAAEDFAEANGAPPELSMHRLLELLPDDKKL